MLTPAKIKNYHFESAGRNAYRADSVDRFMIEVAESFDSVFRENAEMSRKISLLAEKLEEYKNDEDNIRNALITAQRMAEQIQREAKEKAAKILTDVAERESAENERIDAQTTELMNRAAYEAKKLIEDAQKEAEKIVYDATHESKEAAIAARDWMIKEEAALEMMKVEVTKFKKQILDAYSAQLTLIEQIPEIAAELIEEEKAAEAAAAHVEEPCGYQPAGEAVAVVDADPVAPVDGDDDNGYDGEPVVVPAGNGAGEDISVEHLQTIIADEEGADVGFGDIVNGGDDTKPYPFSSTPEPVISPAINNGNGGWTVVAPQDDETDDGDNVNDPAPGGFTDSDIPAEGESKRETKFKVKPGDVQVIDKNSGDYFGANDDDDDVFDDEDDEDDDDGGSKYLRRKFFKK